jgi:hydroxyacylglutathione hydrolase
VILDQFRLGGYLNFTYLVADSERGDAVVIDPSYGIDTVLRAIDERGVHVRFVLNTHSHADHIAGNKDVKERTGAKIVAHRSVPYRPDVTVADGDRVAAGRLSFEVLHTPGHTKDSVLYLFDGHVATGDTLFVGECGRTDLPGGDSGEMYDSLFGRVVKLDDATVVLPGHDYGVTPTSTIGREKEENYVLAPRTKEEFVRFLAE